MVEALRPAVPIGDFYFRALPGSTDTLARDARRRAGSEVLLADLRETGGQTIDHPRLRWLQIS